MESESVTPSAYIVKEYCDEPSNFSNEINLDEFLKKYNVPGICGVDTRALAKHIREQGVMNGIITSKPDFNDYASIKAYSVSSPVNKVSTDKIYLVKSELKENAEKVALLDFGVGRSVLRALSNRGCDVYVLPYNTKAEDILSLAPDGIFLSGGPGDPTENADIVENIRTLNTAEITTMAVGLGHQLLAMSCGMRTERLAHGHRGTNHPVRDLRNGRIYITAQNHGYAVQKSSLYPEVADELYVNVNDGTIEGIEYKKMPAFSVQFEPCTSEFSGGTGFLYDRFVDMLTK